MAAEAHGIVLVNDVAARLRVTAQFREGSGDLVCRCRVTPSIRVVLYATISAISALESYVEGLSADRFATHDLIIDMNANNHVVDGESYGLPLAMAIASSMLRKQIPHDVCFTGVVSPGGTLLPVDAIDRKRTLAPTLGYRKLVLPSRQLDYFNTAINQCPVDSLFAAIGGQFWEHE